MDMFLSATHGASSSSSSSRSTCSTWEPLVSSNTMSQETSTSPVDLLKTLYALVFESYCWRFETEGSPSRRVKCRRVPQPRWVDARPSAKGGKRGGRRWVVREVEIPRPSCSSRAQVGCACSRGLQASTRGKERAASRERPSRPRPRAADPF
jgi:hypothetical protein